MQKHKHEPRHDKNGKARCAKEHTNWFDVAIEKIKEWFRKKPKLSKRLDK